VLKVQGIKEPVALEKVYDFTPVRKIRADLEAKNGSRRSRIRSPQESQGREKEKIER
jgi:hypothetical protein